MIKYLHKQVDIGWWVSVGWTVHPRIDTGWWVVGVGGVRT